MTSCKMNSLTLSVSLLMVLSVILIPLPAHAQIPFEKCATDEPASKNPLDHYYKDLTWCIRECRKLSHCNYFNYKVDWRTKEPRSCELFDNVPLRYDHRCGCTFYDF